MAYSSRPRHSAVPASSRPSAHLANWSGVASSHRSSDGSAFLLKSPAAASRVLTLAAVSSALLWLFAGWTASAATQATMAGAELELPTRIWFAVGNFVSAYLVVLAAALVAGACAIAGWLRGRAET